MKNIPKVKCAKKVKIENIYQQKNIWDIAIVCTMNITNSGISALRVKCKPNMRETFGKETSTQTCFCSIVTS